MSTKKKILAAALAVCLLSIASFGTLAWFNASESVTNKFMVATTGSGASGPGSSTEEKIFSLDLWETVKDDTDGDGILEEKQVSYRENGGGWSFNKAILPGVPFGKAPTVENTGSYDQWVRVVVTVNNAQEWIGILGKYGITDLGSIFLGHDDRTDDGDPAEWESHAAGGWRDTTANTINFVYYLNEALKPTETAVLFEQVQLPGALTQADMATLLNSAGDVGFDITIRADAIQTTGIVAPGTNAEATNAQQAFEYIGWTADMSYDQAMTPAP